jgi:O-antigen/teichoic acid export membrane protein
MFAPLILNNVGMSVLNNEIGLDGGRRYRRVFWALVGATAMMAISGAFLIGAMGPWLLSLFGPEFSDGRLVLLILLASAVVEALAVAAYHVMQSHEKMWLSLLCINLPRDGLIVLLAWILTPMWGARGLAAAYALAWTVTLLVITFLTFRLGLNMARDADRNVLHVSS